MKRKDWKIKKLIKGIYGKRNSKKLNRVRPEKIFFLRKLFLKKNSTLFKKNLISNFFMYNSVLNNIKIKKNNYLKNYFLLNRFNCDIYHPNFFLNKKLFSLDLNLNNFLLEFKLNYIFINKNNSSTNVKGNNIILMGNNKNLINFKNLILNNKNEDQVLPISLKYESRLKNQDININFFLNYNISILINLEIYKILILMYLNNLNFFVNSK